MNHALPRRAAAAVLFVLTCIAIGPSLTAADWPGFRGPQGDGTASDAKVPTEWGDEQNLKWKLDLPGKGFSSPIVVGDNVLVTCYGKLWETGVRA